MKKLILAAIAATVAVGPLAVSTAEAQSRQTTVVRERPNGTVVTRTTTRSNNYRTWRAGQRFDRRYAQSYRRLDNWRGYRLAAPDRGQYWARSGRDAILVRPNGTIVSVRTRVF